MVAVMATGRKRKKTQISSHKYYAYSCVLQSHVHTCIQTVIWLTTCRVEIRSGHPGYILSGSSGSDLVYKISGWILYWIICANNGISIPDHSSELSVLDSDNGSMSPNSPQDILMN